MQQYDTVAISGMGGIGKTELAVQYARTHLEQQTYPGGVVWLKAREDIASKIVLFARSLLMHEPPDDFELAEQVEFYWLNWQDAKTLVILDDVQDYGAIKSLLPTQSHFKILLTTRLTLQSPVQNFEIKVLSEETAIEFLRAIATQDREDKDLRFLEEIRGLEQQLCHWLGYLPLGIELVGRYLARRRDTSLEDLWQRLQDKKLDAKALKDATPEMNASLGVAAAFELSWQELKEDAQRLAALLSLFALAEVPWMLVEACLPDIDSEALGDVRDESLLNLHLLERTRQETYQLHQLLREFFASKREQQADTDALKQALCRVMVVVGQLMPEMLTLTVIEHVTPVIPHLKEAATTLAPWLTDEDWLTPAIGLARFYQGQSAYAEALRWYQACLTNAEIRFGADHPDVAISLNNLANFYDAQGRYGTAEPLILKALVILEQHLGADHPNVAINLSNLANLYLAQGRYGEAEPLFIRALAISEQQLGADHPRVANKLDNLANLYLAQGRYGEAEPLFLKAFAILEQQLGADHPRVANTLNNLASLYCAQGRYGEAEPFYLRDLAISEQQLGVDHPHVATTLNNLASLYRTQERYGEAEPLFLRALAISEQRLGIDHPDVAARLNNLASLYGAQGRYGEAEPLFLRALAISEQQLGLDHPDVATRLNNLAELYRKQGRYGEAEPLYIRGLTILDEKLGDDHPNTQTGRQNFRLFLQAVMEAGETGQLSDHPVTQRALREIREGNRV